MLLQKLKPKITDQFQTDFKLIKELMIINMYLNNLLLFNGIKN
jgi:hypothetical protein